MFSKIVLKLEEEIRDLEKAAFEFPPENYAKFLEAVGKRNGMKRAIIKLHEALKEDDEIN